MARRLVRLFFLAASATTSSALTPAWALRPAPRVAKTVVAAVAPAPVWVAGACVGGVLGTPCVVAATKSWYGDGTLKLPSWTPPKGIFAPVWTALYACIGLAGYKAAAAGGLPRLAVVHYLANLAWAPVFFGLKQLKAGLVLNVGLLASLVAVLPAFKAVGAAVLLKPYFAWLCFATVLNLKIVQLNPNGVESDAVAWTPATAPVDTSTLYK